jgi:hypothetical protein
LTAVDGSDQNWLKDRLRHSHEPAAADRIRRLVKTLDAQWLLTNDDIRTAADLRNFYTHFDKEIEQRLPTDEGRIVEMHNLGARLRVLCELVLVDAMGFPKKEVRERMEKSRRLERHLIRHNMPEE